MGSLSEFRTQLPSATRQLLGTVWNEFVRSGKWPKLRVIESRAGGPEAFLPLLAPLDGSYILENEPEHSPILELRILGILCTPEGPRYLRLLEGYLRFLRHLYIDAPEIEEILGGDVAAFLDLSDEDVTMLGRLLGFMSAVGILNASGTWGATHPGWTFNVPRRSKEIPEGNHDQFLEKILADFADPNAKVWIQERRKQQADAASKLVGAGIAPVGPSNPFDCWYQVFVSSTYSDLIVERQHVVQALLLTHCIPLGMELFPASARPPWDVITQKIDDADYYVLIVAGRYGSLFEGGPMSYTEKEFHYALEKGKPVLAFCHENIGDLPSSQCESSDEGRDRLKSFIAKIENGRTCKYWTTADGLESAVKSALHNAILDFPRHGWSRSVDPIEAIDDDNGLFNPTPIPVPLSRHPPGALAHLDDISRRSAEKLLEFMWGATDQRLLDREIPTLLGTTPEAAEKSRFNLYAASLANRMENRDISGTDWVFLTSAGRTYVLDHTIHRRIPLMETSGLAWNERREPVCKNCVMPLSFFDERSLRCSHCGKDYAPNHEGRPVSVAEALKLNAGHIPI